MTDRNDDNQSPEDRALDGQPLHVGASSHCHFCPPSRLLVFHETDLITCLWDGFPVSKGHALVVTRRHVPDWFQATDAERAALMEGIEAARKAIEAHHHPAGY